MFIVENHFRNIETKNGRMVTTKDQPGQHGIGLFNVRLLCEKYGGVYDMEIDDGVFTTSICLPKKRR